VLQLLPRENGFLGLVTYVRGKKVSGSRGEDYSLADLVTQSNVSNSCWNEADTEGKYAQVTAARGWGNLALTVR
jgi:hypothetical protein